MTDLERLADKIGLTIPEDHDDPVDFWVQILHLALYEGQYSGVQLAVDLARSRGLDEFAAELDRMSRSMVIDSPAIDRPSN